MDIGHRTSDGAPARSGSAVLDRCGRYLRIDEAACSLLGISAVDAVGSVAFARIPDGPDEVWWLEERSEVTRTPLVCSLSRGNTHHQWALDVTAATESTRHRAAVRGYTERTLDAVADRDSIVRALADEITVTCGLIGGFIILIDEETGDPTFASGVHPRREQLAAMQECRRRGAPMVIWQAFEENRIVVKRGWGEHVRRDPRLEPMRAYARSIPDHWSYVTVPFELAGRRIGVVSGMAHDPAVITPERVRLWCEIAPPTAVAVHCARVIRSARAADSDRERQRLNEDLHDTVAQDVFALKMLAARTEVDARRADVTAVADLASELRSLAEKTSSGLRTLIGERRQVGQALRLSQQLTGLAREMGSRSGVEVQATVSDAWDHLDPDCRDTVVRVVQEALRNIEKHAHARNASLRVGEDAATPGMMLIEVADDGESFDPGGVGSSGFGLTSIRERAADHGGSVEIRTVPSTTLRVRIRPSFESEWDAAVRG